MLTRKATQNKEKLVQQFKTWPEIKGKISFELGRKTQNLKNIPTSNRPNTSYTPHRTAHVTAKMRYGVVIVLAKL